MTDYLTTLIATVANDVWTTLVHNWPYLLASVVVASLVQVYLDQNRLAAWLRRRTWIAILAAVALGALTPFCSCGTTAIVLGAMASSVPWAPIVAFMASSPLTSPEEYVLSVGLFGPTFATTFFLAAIAVGLIGGGAAWWLERHGLLTGQARMATTRHDPGCGPSCDAGEEPATGAATRTSSGPRLLDVIEKPITVAAPPAKLRQLGDALLTNLRRLALYFLGFATLGYLVTRILPTGLITDWLGTGNPVWSVPLAALLGIPVYLNTDVSLPLVASLLAGGMAPGAGIAFLSPEPAPASARSAACSSSLAGASSPSSSAPSSSPPSPPAGSRGCGCSRCGKPKRPDAGPSTRSRRSKATYPRPIGDNHNGGGGAGLRDLASVLYSKPAPCAGPRRAPARCRPSDSADGRIRAARFS